MRSGARRCPKPEQYEVHAKAEERADRQVQRYDDRNHGGVGTRKRVSKAIEVELEGKEREQREHEGNLYVAEPLRRGHRLDTSRLWRQSSLRIGYVSSSLASAD